MKSKETDVQASKGSGSFLQIFVTIFILFFLTRSCPFPSSTYWDLLYARDFEVEFGLVFIPESFSFLVEQTFGSLTALKAVYHVLFFMLCGILTIKVFKGSEPSPGLIALAIFAFGLQPLLSLRWSLQLIFLAALFIGFEGKWFKNAYGVALIPIMAAGSALGLPVWLFVVFVACHVIFGKDFFASLLLCALIGILFFPEGLVWSIAGPTPPSLRFPNPEDIMLLNLLAGIFLLSSLISLPRLSNLEIPNIVFYAITGILALLNFSYIPIFILMGIMLSLSAFSSIKPFSPMVKTFALFILATFLNLFLYFSPVGFRINPQVRSERGSELAPILKGEIQAFQVSPWEVGELVWKGLLSLDSGDFEILKNKSKIQISLVNNEYKILPKGGNHETSDRSPDESN